MDWSAALVALLGLVGVGVGAIVATRATERQWLHEQRITAYADVLSAIRRLQAALEAMEVAEFARRREIERPGEHHDSEELLQSVKAANGAAFRGLFVVGRHGARQLAALPRTTSKAAAYAIGLPDEHPENAGFDLSHQLGELTVALLTSARQELPRDRFWTWPWSQQPSLDLWRFYESETPCPWCGEDVRASSFGQHLKGHTDVLLKGTTEGRT